MLEGEAATTDAVLYSQERAAARDRTQGGGAAPHREETAPGHSFEQTKQSPAPLVPAAAVTGMSPSGRACGCHYKFPALHRAQPRHRADNKRFSWFPHRLCAAPTSTPEPKPGAGRKQRSSTQPLLALEGRLPLSPAFAPGQGTSENPTLSGFSTPCWPESEDEPRVLHTHPRARQSSARSRSRSLSRAAPGVCAARVGKPATPSPAVSGGQGGEEQRAGLTTAPPGPGNSREAETRQNKTQATTKPPARASPGPKPRRLEPSRPGGGARQGAPAVPFRCIDG